MATLPRLAGRMETTGEELESLAESLRETGMNSFTEERVREMDDKIESYVSDLEEEGAEYAAGRIEAAYESWNRTARRALDSEASGEQLADAAMQVRRAFGVTIDSIN